MSERPYTDAKFEVIQQAGPRRFVRFDWRNFVWLAALAIAAAAQGWTPGH